MYCGTCAAECCTVFDSSRRLSATLRIPCALLRCPARPVPETRPSSSISGTWSQQEHSDPTRSVDAVRPCPRDVRLHMPPTRICNGAIAVPAGMRRQSRGVERHRAGGTTKPPFRPAQKCVFPQGYAGSRVTQISASTRSSTRRHLCPRMAVPNSGSRAEVSTNTVVPGSTATTSGLLRAWTFRAKSFYYVSCVPRDASERHRL